MHFNLSSLPRPRLASGTKPPSRLITIAASLFAAALVSSCGGGGTTTDQVNNFILPTASSSGLRPLPAAFATRKAVAYSPFRTNNRDTEFVTTDHIKEDLELIHRAGIGLIRLFDSSEKSTFKILQVIHDNPTLDIQVMLGIYVQTFEYVSNPVTRTAIEANNREEMARGVALAKSYPEVVAVSVGNETMVTWSTVPISTKTMAGYIQSVRDQITQPVTTDDNWAFYAGHGRNSGEQAADVFRQIDFASVHSYAMIDALYSDFSDSDPAPDWDWWQLGVNEPSQRAEAMMNAAINKTKKDYFAARAFLDKSGRANLPIVIGETGWKAVDPGGAGRNGRYRFLGSPVNQQMYYSRLLDWAAASKTDSGPKGIVYFEAFDEPWKGSDDKWGLFNVGRQARCAAQSLNPTAGWTTELGSCDPANARYFKLPIPNEAALDRLVIHSEAFTGWPTGMRVDAYEGGTFTLTYPAIGDSAIGDMGATLANSHYLSLSNFTPKPYGWGLLWQSSAVPAISANMSNFANGTVRFSIKTSYLGKLRVGLSSDTHTGSYAEAFVLVSNGNYGYCSGATPNWCDVSIPLSAFKVANPALDLRYILERFSVSDVWSDDPSVVSTGNTARTGMGEIRLDNIYWAK